MSLNWLLCDAIEQLDALASSTNASSDLAQAVEVLEQRDIKAAMTHVQEWLVKFGTPEDLREICFRLLAIEKHATSMNTKSQQNLPRQEDKKESAEDKSDSSWTFYILNTLGLIFEAVTRVEKPDGTVVHIPKRLNGVPLEVINFCFARLHHNYSSAIQHGAGRCLGVLSDWFLEQVVQMFIKKASSVSGDEDEREFAKYQKAVQNIHFGFTEARMDTTIVYMQKLHKFMKDVQRGVLKSEICDSLGTVFTRIMQIQSPEEQQDWQNFRSQYDKISLFMKSYENIFKCVFKWSKKEKHREKALDLLWRMEIFCNDYNFYSSNKEDVFANLVKGLSKHESRLPCLKAIHGYVKFIPEEFVTKNVGAFTDKMKLFVHGLQKVRSPDKEEQTILTHIIEEIGHKHIHFVVHDVVKEMFQSKNPHSSKQKGLLLVALGRLARKYKSEMNTHNYYLGPLVARIIATGGVTSPSDKSKKLLSRANTIALLKKARSKGKVSDDKVEDGAPTADDLDLLLAAMSCFPHIRPEQDEELENMAAAVGVLTLRPERGIASQAVQCMKDFFELDPSKYLVPTLFCYIDILANMDKPDRIKYTLSSLDFLINATRDLMASDKVTAEFSPSEWTALRQHLEGAALLWLINDQDNLRFQMAHALSNFCCKEIRALEGDHTEPFLVDALFPDGNIDVSRSPEFLDVLCEVLKTSYGDFSGVISWAWSQMHQDVQDVLPLMEGRAVEGNIESQPWFKLYPNKFRFLCLGIRMPEVGMLSDDERPRASNSRPHIFCAPPSLTDFDIKQAEADFFFSKVLAVLHLPTLSPVYSGICHNLTADLAEIHHSCYEELASHLRRPFTERDIPQSPLKKRYQARELSWTPEKFYQHEQTLAVLASLLNHIEGGEQYNSESGVCTTLSLLLEHWIGHERARPSFDHHSYRSREYMVELTSHYIALTKNSDSAKVLEQHQQLFELLTHRLLPSMEAATDDSCPATPSSRHGGRSLSVTPVKESKRRSVFTNLKTRTRSNTNESQDLEAMEHQSLGPEEVVADKTFESLQKLENSVLVGLVHLIEGIGPFDEAGFLNQVMLFLHQIAFRGEHVYAGISKVLEVLLWNHPHKFDDFVTKSFGRAHTTETNRLLLSWGIKSGVVTRKMKAMLESSHTNQSAGEVFVNDPENHPELTNFATAFSVLYAKAVLNNFVNDVDVWITKHKVPLAKILLFSLFQQTCIDSATRCLAWTVSKRLAERKAAPKLDPGFKIRVYSHQSYLMYTQTTLQYSRALANRAENFPDLILSLFSEATSFYSHIDVRQCDLLIRMLSPWASHVGLVLKPAVAVNKRNFLMNYGNNDAPVEKTEEDKQLAQKAQDILASMFALTRMCQLAYKTVTMPALNNLWANLLAEDYAAIVVPQVVKFLVHQFTHARAMGSDLELLPKTLLLHLSRARDEEMSKLIIDNLVKHLRQYSDDCPFPPTDFLQWQKEQSSCMESPNPAETDSFGLILNFVFENGPLFASYYPELLQNAVVLFQGTTDSNEMLSYIAVNLGVGNDNDTPISASNIVGAVCKANREVAVQWSKVTMTWALNSKDATIAARSLALFQELEQQLHESFNFGDGQKTLIQLSSSLQLAIRLNQVDRMQKIIGILLMPTVVPYDTSGWIGLTSMGWALLCMSEVPYFKSGLTLLTHMFTTDVVSREEQKQWLLSLGEHLSFFRREADQRLDEAVAEVALKGFTSAQTSQDTLSVLQALAPFYKDQLPYNNRLVCLLLLGTVILRSIDVLEFSKPGRGREMTKSERHAQDVYHISNAKDCLDLSVLLGQYQEHEEEHDHSEGPSTHLAGISAVLEEFAISSSKQVPDFMDLSDHLDQVNKIVIAVDEHGDQQDVEGLPGLVQKMEAKIAERMAQNGGNVSRSSAADFKATASSIDAGAINTMTQFFSHFCGMFDDRESFDFVVNVFSRLLKYGPSSWHMVLLQMLALFIKSSSHKTDAKQFTELSDVLVLASQSHKKEISRLAKDAAFAMSKRTQFHGQVAHVFNFLRPLRHNNVRPTGAEGVLMASSQENAMGSKERADCLNRIEKQTFPILQHMYNNPRSITGLDPDALQGQVLPDRPQMPSSQTDDLPVPITPARTEKASAESPAPYTPAAKFGPPPTPDTHHIRYGAPAESDVEVSLAPTSPLDESQMMKYSYQNQNELADDTTVMYDLNADDEISTSSLQHDVVYMEELSNSPIRDNGTLLKPITISPSPAKPMSPSPVKPAVLRQNSAVSAMASKWENIGQNKPAAESIGAKRPAGSAVAAVASKWEDHAQVEAAAAARNDDASRRPAPSSARKAKSKPKFHYKAKGAGTLARQEAKRATGIVDANGENQSSRANLQGTIPRRPPPAIPSKRH